MWRDGAVVYCEGFGSKDEAGTPVTPDTVFQIGSDTKKIAALALLQQVEAHAIELDSSVASVIPDLRLASNPRLFETLEVRDLLRQSSGLFDYSPWAEAAGDEQLAAIAFGRFAQNEYSLMPPGIAWNYSNPNYSLIGLLSERLDGRAWPELVTDEVFQPLGMRHSYARRDDVLRNETDVASSYGVILDEPLDTFSPFDGLPEQRGWVKPEATVDNAFARPAGLVWSTAEDQARLLGFLADGDEAVLSDELREAMSAPQVPVDIPSVAGDYGYGLLTAPGFRGPDGQYRGARLVEHNGGTLTMSSYSVLLPEQRVAVSILANAQGQSLADLAYAVLAAAAAERLPEPSTPPPPPPPENLPSYAGAYSDANLGEVTIEWETDHLSIRAPLLDVAGVSYQSTLQALAHDQFNWVIAGADFPLSFYDAPNGRAHGYGVSELFVLTRTDAPVQIAEDAAPR
ncbi:MAG TPA: serine hydrolase domain-containing protein [Polyangiaceae bacterium]|nr:serine hydrolase domain-containing protein [Polyangiaceae bacterium]